MSEKLNNGCCVVFCEQNLDQKYWDAQYQSGETRWDLGEVSGALRDYFEGLTDKNLKILIPGCGNAYEAAYLLSLGFTDITLIDIAPSLTEVLQKKYADTPEIKIITGDFFAHQDRYNLIVEQTFFCALPKSMRQKYVWKMHQLLHENGRLVGLLFDREFETSPPFGGSKSEYEALFKGAFAWEKLEIASNSAPARQGTELFIDFEKQNQVVSLYAFEGITCNGCKNTVTEKILALNEVTQVTMSNDFADLLIVSKAEIALSEIEKELEYEPKYSVKKY